MRVALRRLKRRPEFLRVAGSKRKWAAPGLVLQVGRDHIREGEGDRLDCGLGFTVSRKVGMAVTRNRAKRRLRAAAEQVFPLHAAPGRDYVLIGRKATVDRPFPDLVEDMKTALRRLDAWREDWREDGEETG
ncbi:MAG: ribonuclease P protein component [Rhodospirillaceae bacterium]|jgi:ribonuclease P protein component|nr:ribonuclease P protein component [Rhodospirillaceae bacterium]MBT6119611.1 ribonuclease P protein component [Rhodospirillaceae bacterium]